MKLDILAFAAHPDDMELSCSGTIASHIAQGYRVGAVDFTRGEMGTRGTAEIREVEARESSKILGLTHRDNLGFEDAFFQNDRKHQMEVIRAIRKYQPDIILANATHDRHPDHGKAAQLVIDSYFLSGLSRVALDDEEGNALLPWRPRAVYHYIQSQYVQPHFIVDVSDHWETKMKSVRAFKSQFYDPDSAEPETYISSPAFMQILEARAKDWGHSIGAVYGEGFTINRNIGISNLNDLL